MSTTVCWRNVLVTKLKTVTNFKSSKILTQDQADFICLLRNLCRVDLHHGDIDFWYLHFWVLVEFCSKAKDSTVFIVKMNVLSKLELDYSILVSCLVISIYYFYQKLESVPNWVSQLLCYSWSKSLGQGSNWPGQWRPIWAKKSLGVNLRKSLVESAKISWLKNCRNIYTFNTFHM